MRYYGCKDKILDTIELAVRKADLYPGAKFVDLFTGTTAVAKHFKRLGYTVIANDNLEFCYSLAKTYIETNELPKFTSLVKILNLRRDRDIPSQIIEYLNNLDPVKSFIYNNYAPTATNGLRKYFSDENAAKIDAIRTKLEEWKRQDKLKELEFYYLLTSLIEAINLVSNVAGTYGASLKTWDKRALKPLVLNRPEIIPSKRRNKAYKKDANKLVREISADILYLDPPYNTRQYASNYFLLELVAEGWFDRDLKPSGITGAITEEDKLSDYSRKATAFATFKNLIDHARTRFFVVSYSNEGIISQQQLKGVLSTRCTVEVIENKQKHKRYKSVNQTESSPKTVDEYVYFVKVDNVKPRFNNLGGADWLQNSFSVWRDIKKNREEIQLQHPAMFPIDLASKVIESYTRKNQVVLDPFLGSGSSAIAALKLERKAIGIDLNADYIRMARERLKSDYSDFHNENNVTLIQADARDILNHVQANTVDLCITSPPYWDILNQTRSADNKTAKNYSDNSVDLGNIHDYDKFLNALDDVFAGVYQATKSGGFLVVNVMDIRKKSHFFPLHANVIEKMSKIGYKLRDIVIWDRSSEYNNMKPLGYPYSFIINKVHEYLLIFEK